MSPAYSRKLASIAVVAVAACPLAPAGAQGWPERPVRIVNPFAAGAASDVVARLIADKLSQRLGKSFIVDNRPGANAIIGTEIVAKAAPDGYTVLSGGNTTHAANPSLYKSLPYDPLKDFTPVAFIVGLHYYLVVAPNFPARSVRELIAYAKANPGKLSYGTGNATSTISAEMFKLATGTDFAQVNYKGNPLAAADIIGGTLTTMFLDNSTARPLLQGAKLRALGVAALSRSEIFPEVPTLAEAGLPGINLTAWIAMWFPANTPRAVVDRLNAEVNAARAMPEVTQKLKELGFTLEGSGPRPDEFAEFVKSEIALWARVVREAKIPQQ
jgi:tripartite-type tricarboxylate transporter receptor subunit TctC